MSCVDKNSDSQDIIGTGVDDNRNTIQDEEKKRTELKSFSFLVGGEGHQSSGDGNIELLTLNRLAPVMYMYFLMSRMTLSFIPSFAWFLFF